MPEREYTPHRDRRHQKDFYRSIAYHIETIQIKNDDGTAQTIFDAFPGTKLIYGSNQSKRYGEAIGSGTAPVVTFYHTSRGDDKDHTYGSVVRPYFIVVEAFAGDDMARAADLEDFLMLAFEAGTEADLYTDLSSSPTEIGTIKFSGVTSSPQVMVTQAAGEEGHIQITLTASIRVFQSDF